MSLKIQRDPYLSSRVLLGFDALRTLIIHFDQRGVGRTVGLLAKLLDAQGGTKSTYSFLQRMLESYQDRMRTRSWLVVKISL
jgi:hypothetical protein